MAGTAAVLALTTIFFVTVFAVRPSQTSKLAVQMEASLKDYYSGEGMNSEIHLLWDQLQVPSLDTQVNEMLDKLYVIKSTLSGLEYIYRLT